jgi:hypothetical protein
VFFYLIRIETKSNISSKSLVSREGSNVTSNIGRFKVILSFMKSNTVQGIGFGLWDGKWKYIIVQKKLKNPYKCNGKMPGVLYCHDLDLNSV